MIQLSAKPISQRYEKSIVPLLYSDILLIFIYICHAETRAAPKKLRMPSAAARANDNSRGAWGISGK